MSTVRPPQVIITAAQLGGYWYGVRVNPDATKSIVTEGAADKKSAEIVAKEFAKEKGLEYQQNALIPHKPVVTVWRYFENWLPAKVFADRLEGAGTTTPDKEKAKRNAQALAEREGLEYLPCLGEDHFRGVE